jgi:flagellar biogenesis protein FliO
MNGKTNRQIRQPQFAEQLQAASSAPKITLASQEAPPTRLFFAFEKAVATLNSAWKWMQERSKVQRRARKLRVCETAQLGDKRFVALIQADGQRFLVGGTSNSVTLLATLPRRKNARERVTKATPFEVHES